jgi:hypothetical protein
MQILADPKKPSRSAASGVVHGRLLTRVQGSGCGTLRVVEFEAPDLQPPFEARFL